MIKQIAIAAVVLCVFAPAHADFRLTKGEARSAISQDDADDLACEHAENACDRLDGRSNGCFNVDRDYEVVPGYGGYIPVWSSKYVVGCNY